MSLIVRHLVGLGHRRIAHIAGPQYLSTGRARLRGVRNALAASGLADEPAMIAYGESFTVEEGRRCGDQLMDNDASISAIVCANDLLAIGCYEALGARGLACPIDVSVTGYNDIRFMDKLRPPLTTVRIPTHEIGAEAARTLLARMRDPSTPAREVRLEPVLMVRGSTGPVKADGRSVA
jgi:LacI family transcriptional regulator